MCSRVKCRRCGKATWAGCGAHVNQVLAGGRARYLATPRVAGSAGIGIGAVPNGSQTC